MLAPLDGFLLPLRGLKLIFRPGIRRYVVMPLILNIVSFVLLAWVGIHYFEIFMARYLPEDTWWDFLRPFLWVLFTLVYLVIIFYGFTILANLIASPFNGILAAKVEQHLTGKLPPESNMSVLASIGPAIGGELTKLLYFVKWVIPLLLLLLIAAFVPGLNLLASALWIGFGFWFLSLEYADYPMGNHELKPREQRKRLGKRRIKSLSFGAGISVLMLVLGFVAMPVAVAAATLYWVEDMHPNQS